MRKVALPLLALIPAACHTAAPATKAPVVVATQASVDPVVHAAEIPLGPGKVRFVLFPSDVHANDALGLGARGRLYVGEGGERWLLERDDAAPVPAAQLAPEDLVAAREIGGAILLLGASGAVYTAKAPLADIDAKRPPPAEMRSVSAGREVFVGVTKDGRVLRTTDGGKSWAKVALPKTDALPVAALFSDRREGLVLAAPQRVFATQDDGASFEAIASPVAARGLHRGSQDALFVDGRGLAPAGADGTSSPIATTAAKLVRDGGAPRLAPAPRTTASSWLSLPQNIPFLGHAVAIRDGRAALAGGKLHEIVLTDVDDATVVALATTEPGKLPVVRAIPGLKECDDIHLAGAAGVLYAACSEHHETQSGKLARSMRVRRSDDAGATWSDAGVLDLGATSATARLWALGKQGWLAATSEDGVVVRTSGKPFVPSLSGTQEAPILQQVLVAAGGERVYALATVADRLALLVSKDAGKSFVSRPLPEIEPEAFPFDPGPGFAVEEREGKAPSVTIYTPFEGLVRYETVDDGVTFTKTQLPIPATVLSMAGARGLASDGVIGWETIDSGRTWTEVAMPTRRGSSGSDDLACWEGGCVIADRGARLGWEIAGPADVKPWSEPAPQQAAAPTPTRTLTCTIGGAPVSLGRPTPVLVEVGPHAWLAVREDRETGAASALVPVAPKAGAVDLTTREIALLPKGKGDAVLWSAATPGGAVALRFAAKPKNSATSDVEIAWYVASTGKVHRATLDGAATADPALHDREPDGAPRAKATAVIVPGFGVWVRPSAVKGNQDLWLVREGGAKGKKVALPKPWPAGPLSGARVGGQSLVFALHREWNDAQNAVLGVLDDAGTAWSHAVWSAWPSLTPRAGAAARSTLVPSLAALGGKPSLVVAQPGDEALGPHAWALPIDATSIQGGLVEPVALPLYDALAGKGGDEKVCAPKATGAAIEIPYPAAGRPKVVVRDGGSSRSYAYSNAIVKLGKAKEACASSLVVVTGSIATTPTTDQVVIPLDDLEHATVFRTKYAGKLRAHEAVAASCAFAK